MNNGNVSKTASDSTDKGITVIIIDGEPWFIASEVCAGLELTRVRNALRALDDDEKGAHIVSTLGGPQNVSIVSEPGFYHLAFISRKPAAVAFRRWVTHVVIPAIHKHGFFADPESIMRTRDYLSARRISATPIGFGRTCMAVCRRTGAQPVISRSKKGNGYPVRVLDEAAKGKIAGKPPLARMDGIFDLIFHGLSEQTNSLTA